MTFREKLNEVNTRVTKLEERLLTSIILAGTVTFIIVGLLITLIYLVFHH